MDWWGFRTNGEPVEAVEALRGAFGTSSVEMRVRAGGHMGYTSSADVMLGDMRVGLMAWGGVHQRDWVSIGITGRGCEWVPDWTRAEDAVGELPGIGLRRVDLALDTRDGSVSDAVVGQAYADGEFGPPGAGRPPVIERYQSSDGGRTIYIGRRDQAKFFRGYEKGRELLKDHPGHWQGLITHIDGARVEDLYRLEVEFKPKHQRLPDDLIERRDQYFAGAYPFLGHVLRDVEPEIFVQRRERGPQLDLDAALAQVRHQYGSTLFTALAAYHGDMLAVWDRIVGSKHNGALVDAGVLRVEHEA